MSTSRRTPQKLSADGVSATSFSLVSTEMVRPPLLPHTFLPAVSAGRVMADEFDLATDLLDGGAAHFAETISKIKQKYGSPHPLYLLKRSSVLTNTCVRVFQSSSHPRRGPHRRLPRLRPRDHSGRTLRSRRLRPQHGDRRTPDADGP
jgi:hypothetical protein